MANGQKEKFSEWLMTDDFYLLNTVPSHSGNSLI